MMQASPRFSAVERSSRWSKSEPMTAAKASPWRSRNALSSLPGNPLNTQSSGVCSVAVIPSMAAPAE
ncbi:hypothetical protein [Mangrovicoccus sp. HB161399]|uniref:hypothetical protein n=1 Tax=Mangrovicoccus sp. HB161399 TaxID=2720392 RepID=UPI001551D35D|nr:hypothetical protein [Mangrovicoccus sp. HB161399]